jgi:uncharacterized protein (DUF4415 family)
MWYVMGDEDMTTMQWGEGLEDSKTDWKRLKEMKDEEIDCSDIPPLEENIWKNAVIVKPDTTERITLRLKTSVLESYVRSQNRTH